MVNIKYKSILGLGCCLILGMGTALGQTAVGKKTVENETVILDFKEGDKRGIILPWILEENQVDSPVGGTLIFDSKDKKVKYYKEGTNPGWVDLSIHEGQVDLSIQQAYAENTAITPTVIGSRTSAAKGVLVLETTTKAMVLPRMESPHLNLLSPQAGTMVFDTVSKMLCIFNGNEWSFWKVN
ncbi:hypothetical protein [Myroides sp. WP-1]|uniref:hypothetical protein n=1 Tax=Myroides sp. WP-1 TaxID=2759944 RepID=UPI0015FA2C78|nr:hypothetical protein [Myroides sp. WP-1]MBB1138231.1 hypothetical protein [Myroides sp. WP-1]